MPLIKSKSKSSSSTPPETIAERERQRSKEKDASLASSESSGCSSESEDEGSRRSIVRSPVTSSKTTEPVMKTTVTTDMTLTRPMACAGVILNTVSDQTSFKNDFTAPPFPVPQREITVATAEVTAEARREFECQTNTKDHSSYPFTAPVPAVRRIVKSESVPISIAPGKAPVTVSHEVTLSNEPHASATGITKTTFVITTKSSSGILRNAKERSPAKGLPVTFSDQTINHTALNGGTTSSRSHYDMANYANDPSVQYADDETVGMQSSFSKSSEREEAEAVIQKVPADLLVEAPLRDVDVEVVHLGHITARLTPKRISSEFPEIINVDSGSEAGGTEPPETSMSFSTEHDDVRIVSSIRDSQDQGSHRILKTTVTLSPKENAENIPTASVKYRTTGPAHPNGYNDLGATNLPDTHIRSFPISPSRKTIPIQMTTMRRTPKSIIMPEDPGEIIHHHPVFVKDTSKYWYKPAISREQAINILRDQPPGTFVVRDSNSFPGAFGLALKVATPPPGVQAGDGTELVRHFLIEPSPKGVKLKGCNNEPVFGSLSALVYQHSITPLALPAKLILPEYDPATSAEHVSAKQMLLEQGAACNVAYIGTVDCESLTGPACVKRCVARLFDDLTLGYLTPVSVHFKVSSQGVTLTDNTRKLFFRRHYPVHSVIYAGSDPDDRRWDNTIVTGYTQGCLRAATIFAVVARKVNTLENQCHVFAEFEPEQPAHAVLNFINKVLLDPSRRN